MVTFYFIKKMEEPMSEESKEIINEIDDIKEFENKEERKVNSHIKYKRDDNNRVRLMRLWSIFGMLVIILIIALIATNCNGDAEKKEEDKIEEKSTTEAVDEEKAVLTPVSEDNEVYKLIAGFIDAAYVKCDVEALAALVDSTDNYNIERNLTRQKHIEAYSDIKCYVLDSSSDKNVVFFTYNVKLYNYETLIPAAEMIMIIKVEDGVYKIHNMEVSEKFEAHITNEKQVKALAELQEKIQSEYNAVIESNSEIKSIIDILNSTKNE